MKKERLLFLDIFRGFAIILIVLGHTYCQSIHCENIVRILYSFHVPMFFLISGYLFNIKNIKFKDFLKKKFIRILIPYFCWALLFLIPYYLFGNDVVNQLESNSSFNFWKRLLYILLGNGNSEALNQNSSLWFLPTLFSMEIIYYFVLRFTDKHSSKKYLVLLCTLVLAFIADYSKIILPFGISNVFILGVFFYIGYLFKECNSLSKIKSFKFELALIVLLVGVYASITNYTKVSYMDYIYGNMLLMFIAGLFLSMFFVYVSYKISNNKVLEYIGTNTMGILIFHKIIILLFQTKLGSFSKTLLNSNIFVELLLGILVATIAIIISLIINYIIKKYFPLLIGEYKVRSNYESRNKKQID